MRILIISPTQSGIGGIAQYVTGLSKYLKNNNHEVEIISSENTFTIPVKKLKNPSFMLSAFFKTKFKKNYDIVHAQNPMAALAMRNVPGKKVLSLLGMYSEQINLLHGATAGKLSNKLEKKALNWADALIVQSKEMYDLYSEKGYPVYFIPNAIDKTSLPETKKKIYKKQILFAGRLSKEKGILDVLDAAKNLPNDIHTLIAGNGPEEDKVKKISNERPNVHYLGFQPKEKLIPLLRGSDLLVQPSIMEGGTSTTLLEAMICGTTIIATAVGGSKETLYHMKTAYVVKPNNPKEIIEGILKMLNDKPKCDELAKNALEQSKKFEWENVGKQYLEIYQKLCK